MPITVSLTAAASATTPSKTVDGHDASNTTSVDGHDYTVCASTDPLTIPSKTYGASHTQSTTVL